MATEEIEISELELAEELAPDNLIPIESLTDTKATTLQKIRDWLGIESAILKQVPRGVVFPFGGSVAPDGFLICDGSAISRTTYADLFAVIGTIYGNGDGSTTFNLPNLTDKFIQGSKTVGTVKSAGLPNITGGDWVGGYSEQITTTGAVEKYYEQSGGQFSGSNKRGNYKFDASKSNSIYGKSSTVQPPALTMLYCIKY